MGNVALRRVYLPATIDDLRLLVQTKFLPKAQLGATSSTAFAVTPGLREWYNDEDVEELEYAALIEAARASLRLIDAAQDESPRRVVVAVDVPETETTVRDDIDRGVVHVGGSIALSVIASVHIDAEDAVDAVRAGAEAIVRADLGDEEAQETVDDVEGYELSWYATQEIGAFLELI